MENGNELRQGRHRSRSAIWVFLTTTGVQCIIQRGRAERAYNAGDISSASRDAFILMGKCCRSKHISNIFGGEFKPYIRRIMTYHTVIHIFTYYIYHEYVYTAQVVVYMSRWQYSQHPLANFPRASLLSDLVIFGRFWHTFQAARQITFASTFIAHSGANQSIK